jgi:predicted dehydrogenase
VSTENDNAGSTVRVALIGLGDRGRNLLEALLALPGVAVTAIADTKQWRVDEALAIIARAGEATPGTVVGGGDRYRHAIERSDVDAVVTATPWEAHVPIMLAAMDAGKYGASEVPAAVTVDECWALVEASERTGTPMMMLENACYRRDTMAIFSAIRAGLIGDLFHSQGAYAHDVRYVKFDERGADTGALEWRGRHSVHRNGNLYPTHQLGPAAIAMDVNRGTKMDYLVSMSSPQHGMTDYIRERFGTDHPNFSQKFANGDVNVTLIKLENGTTINLLHETQSWRPIDAQRRFQGTKGILEKQTAEDNGRFFSIDRHWDRGKTAVEGEWQWHDLAPVVDEFEHPLWKRHGAVAQGVAGHSGSDYMTLLAFTEAVRHKTDTPLNVYDAASWSVIAPLSEQSVAERSATVEIPDFTRGRWKDTPRFTYQLPNPGEDSEGRQLGARR